MHLLLFDLHENDVVHHAKKFLLVDGPTVVNVIPTKDGIDFTLRDFFMKVT